MPDLTTSAIDRFFDKIDGAVFVADRMLGRAHESVRRSRGSASSTVVAVPRFRVVEATNAQTGLPAFVATDETTRAECRTTVAQIRPPSSTRASGPCDVTQAAGEAASTHVTGPRDVAQATSEAVLFANNDLSCLGAITDVIADLVARRDPPLAELAATYPVTEPLIEAPKRARVPGLPCTRWQDVRVPSFAGDRGHAR